MTDETHNTRLRLIRNVSVLQLKLMVDGLRDALLIPVSLVAALLGLLRGGKDAGREFERVLRLGRRSERWINLFDDPPPAVKPRAAGSMDQLLDHVENVVRDKYSKGRGPGPDHAAVKDETEETVQDVSRREVGK